MEKDKLILIRNNTEAVLKMIQENERIENFLEKLQDEQYLSIKTAHQYELFGDRNDYAFIGEKFAELLKTMLEVRKKHIDSLQITDLEKE